MIASSAKSQQANEFRSFFHNPPSMEHNGKQCAACSNLIRLFVRTRYKRLYCATSVRIRQSMTYTGICSVLKECYRIISNNSMYVQTGENLFWDCNTSRSYYYQYVHNYTFKFKYSYIQIHELTLAVGLKIWLKSVAIFLSVSLIN